MTEMTEHITLKTNFSLTSMRGHAQSFQLCLTFCHPIDHFPGGSDSKESAFNAGVPGLIPGLVRSPGEGNGNPLQCSCMGNPMDR